MTDITPHPPPRRRTAAAPAARGLVLAALAALLVLPGCTQKLVMEPVEEDRLALEAGQARHWVAADVLGDRQALDRAAARIAGDYRQRGAGPVHIALSHAAGDGIAAALTTAGLAAGNVVATRLAPGAGPASGPFAMVTYETVQVAAPDCPRVPRDGTRWGCAVEGTIARMAARPADLAGRGGAAALSTHTAADAVERRRERQVDERPSLLRLLQTTDMN